MESAFDLIVVTAANRAQARGYRAQLRGRANVRVVPDPGDRRVGSLGATVNVLRTHFAHPNAQTPKLPRILICHSGGDAKRTPAYAAMGKAFVPMFIMLGVWCVLRICYIAYVSHTFGELSYIYWAYPITWAISSVMYVIYYLKGDWIHGFD